ncbi:MAG: sensor histidine kinase [Pontiellaceae bacterium]
MALGVERFDLSFDEIKQLTAADLQAKPKVELYGQVIRFHSRDRGLFLFNGESGIYVQPKNSWPKTIRLGSWIRVQGVAVEGIYYPIVRAEEVSVELIDSPLSEAAEFDPNSFYDPTIDSQWIQTSGLIIDYDSFPERDHIMLEIEVFGYQASIQIPYSKENLMNASAFMFQSVRFQGVACVQVNNRRQMTGRIFYISSMDDLEIIESEARMNPSVFTVDHFLNGNVEINNYVTVDGVIAHVDEKNLYLQDGVHHLQVRIKERLDFCVGDKVRISGYAWSQPISRGLRAIEVVKLDIDQTVKPIEVPFSDLRDPQYNHALARVNAWVVDIGKSFGGGTGSVVQSSLLCRSGEDVFECKVPSSVVESKVVEIGMQLQLTGLVHLEQMKDVPWRFSIDRMWLQLRSLDDIVVLAEAPWLTTQRLTYMIAVMVGVIGVTLFFVITLRKTVRRQTELIGSQIRHKSIMSERQRIARELHDNLDQGLAGIALQLSSSIKLFERDVKAGLKGMHRIQEMLIYCSEESRNAILELRGGWLEKMNVSDAIRQFASMLEEQYPMTITVSVEGITTRFERYAERQIFSIAKEAMTNACKHAKAEHIDVRLKYAEDQFLLLVSDDGIGFKDNPFYKSGHFGLLGMEERANRINGKLLINDAEHAGVQIELLVSVNEYQEPDDG